MQNLQLQLADILQYEQFQSAECMTGNINRLVKWVHIIGNSAVGHLIKEHELILTTGMGIHKDVDTFERFLDELIAKNCAGLCIEYGRYIQSIPTTILQKAKKHQFPIVVFHEEVSFSDITQEVLRQIISHQYQLIERLEAYTHTLSKASLTSNRPEALLEVLVEAIGGQCILQLTDEKAVYYPKCDATKKARLEKESPLVKEILLLSQQYGQLKWYGLHSGIESLFLERTALFIAQIILRKLYSIEKETVAQQLWKQDWLEGRLSKPEILQHLEKEHDRILIKQMTVLYVNVANGQLEGQEGFDDVYFTLYARNVFEKRGFTICTTNHQDHYYMIIFNQRDEASMRTRLREAVLKIKKVFKTDTVTRIATGKTVESVEDVPTAYETARTTMYIRKVLQTTDCFYEDVLLGHMILNLQQTMDVKQMMTQYLGPLIAYDEKHSSELIPTLRVYLATNCSKQETAQKLYIVRQTLYHRLKKIEELIGMDSSEPHHRMMLEMMLYAKEFIEKSSEIHE